MLQMLNNLQLHALSSHSFQIMLNRYVVKSSLPTGCSLIMSERLSKSFKECEHT